MAARVPSLNWLRVFEAAARTESFARAATELNMSSAAVSQQVKTLETHLGAPLFIRLPHAVRLTDTGRAYLPPVQQSLMTLEGATEGLFGSSRTQQLYVQSVLIFAHGILSRGMGDFAAAHPGITLNLSTGNAARDFDHGFSDLKIIFGNPHAFGRDSDRLMGEVLYPVARPELAAMIRRPADLLAHPLIEVATHRAGWVHWMDAMRVLPGAARMVFADSTIMAAAMASERVGVALARHPGSDKAVAEAGLVPCLDAGEVAGGEAYHLVYDNRGALRPPARRFRDWLIDWVAAQGWR